MRLQAFFDEKLILLSPDLEMSRLELLKQSLFQAWIYDIHAASSFKLQTLKFHIHRLSPNPLMRIINKNFLVFFAP